MNGYAVIGAPEDVVLAPVLLASISSADISADDTAFLYTATVRAEILGRSFPSTLGNSNFSCTVSADSGPQSRQSLVPVEPGVFSYMTMTFSGSFLMPTPTTVNLSCFLQDAPGLVFDPGLSRIRGTLTLTPVNTLRP